jgi:hypothetical protein
MNKKSNAFLLFALGLFMLTGFPGITASAETSSSIVDEVTVYHDPS